MIAHAHLVYPNLIYDWSCTEGYWPCIARTHPDMSRITPIARQIAESGVWMTANLSYLAAEAQVFADFDRILDDPEFERLAPGVQERWRSDGPDARSFPEAPRTELTNRVGFERALVAELNRAGVSILAGADAPLTGLFPGRALHLELIELVRAGLSPLEALRAATATPDAFVTRYVPGARTFGSLEPGSVADLAILESDPLEDITNLSTVGPR